MPTSSAVARVRRGRMPFRATMLPAVLALIALAGCGDTTTDPHTIKPTPVDVSALVSAATNASYGGVARSLVLLPAVVASPINTSSCPYSSKDQAFVCAPVVRNGITSKTVYQLLDASGHPLSTANALTLAAVRVITDVDGTISLVSTTTGTISATSIHSHADNTLSGLLTATHTLGGRTTEHDSSSSVVNGFPSQLAMSATTTVADLDVPTAAGAFPASGTITSDATTSASFGGNPPSTFDTHAQVTFSGTSLVTIALGVGGSVQHCTLDLAHTSAATCSPG